MYIIGLFVGLFMGAITGFLVGAVLSAGKYEDRTFEDDDTKD